MRSIIQLIGGGAAAVWKGIPTVIKVPLIGGTIILAGAELTRDVNEAYRSSRIFEGTASQADAQSNPDVVKTLADLKAGKATPAATATIAVQYAKTEAESRSAGAMADAATESEQELLAKQAKGIKLTTTQSQRILELKKLRSEAETAQAMSTAARAQALSDKQAAEFNSRLLESLQKGNGDILYTFMDVLMPKEFYPNLAKRR